ncbi:HNH endonuclease [Streptomyces sp. NP160]|uniref:HNH endonuclease n=1 Tax=Streptomyces sp. NP160 TaxID=2586637 RepID=UPI00111A3B29|nr:HNH endonuclease [Streptomyces sp. NP160]
MSNQSRRGKEWVALAQSIKDRDGNTCQYNFGGCTYDKDLTVDHITALDNGGTDDEWNLITACRTCNGRKSNHVLIRKNWYDTKWFPNGIH